MPDPTEGGTDSLGRIRRFLRGARAQPDGPALRLTNDLPYAQDVVQEAFCRAIPRWNSLRTYDDPSAWVRRVAYNLANSGWRRSRVARTYARHQREEHVAGPHPDRVALARALRTLPPQQRKVIVLHYLAGLSVAQIADQEETAEGTVKSRLSKGRAALASQLTDQKKAPRA